jgi:hypothetical protein
LAATHSMASVSAAVDRLVARQGRSAGRPR